MIDARLQLALGGGGLDLPEEARRTLLALSPESYTGHAEQMAAALSKL